MKKLITVILICVTAIVPLLLWFSYYFCKLTGEKFYKKNIKKEIVIKKGESLFKISKKLKNNNLIVNEYLFLLTAKFHSFSKKIQAGEYIISNNLNNYEILKKFIKGSQFYYKFTIREGLTIQETAYAINEQIGNKISFNPEKFIFLCNQQKYNLIKNFIPTIAEGFLFPETYSITKNDNEESIIKMMTDQFKITFQNLMDSIMPYDMSFYDIMKIASIVEKEAKFTEEQPRIAGVYLNRLQQNIKLEADPTVLYVIGHKKRVFYNDLKVNSPYNTYINYGLMPTPICNPGYQAIFNTINFEKHNYIYFVANIDGKHIFSKSLWQHNLNRNKVKRLKRKRKYKN
jgi:UPF0755 protein